MEWSSRRSRNLAGRPTWVGRATVSPYAISFSFQKKMHLVETPPAHSRLSSLEFIESIEDSPAEISAPEWQSVDGGPKRLRAPNSAGLFALDALSALLLDDVISPGTRSRFCPRSQPTRGD